MTTETSEQSEQAIQDPDLSIPPQEKKESTTSSSPSPTSTTTFRESSEEEIQTLRKAVTERDLFQLSIYFLDYLLRSQTALFEQIYKRQGLPHIIISMMVLSGMLSGIYGLTMGINHGFLQTLSSSVKLPILFMLTAAICVPSLYTFNILLGQQFRFLQTVALMITTLGTTTILLSSLAPLSFFFAITTQNYSNQA